MEKPVTKQLDFKQTDKKIRPKCELHSFLPRDFLIPAFPELTLQTTQARR